MDIHIERPILNRKTPEENIAVLDTWISNTADKLNYIIPLLLSADTPTIDSEISADSTNAVQNKALYNLFLGYDSWIEGLYINPTVLTLAICSDLTNLDAFNAIPSGFYYYGTETIPNAPSKYGMMIKYGGGANTDNCALWFAQVGEGLYYASSNYNTFSGWKKIKEAE